MIGYKFARRAFLRGCGGSAVLMLPLLRSIEARAAGAAAPLRLLILQHPLGTYSGLSRWCPAAAATTTSFQLPLESAPFAPLQKYMVMVDGLNLIAVGGGMLAGPGGQNTGEGGMVAMMTGVPTIGSVGQQDHCAGGPSVDQLFLQKSPLLGGPSFANATPFGSLQLAADIRSDRDEVAPRVMSYLAPMAGVTAPALARRPLYPDTVPLNVYSRLFGSALPPGAGRGVLSQNLSAVDYLRRDLARLRSVIPATEKPRLDAYASAIAQLEASLRAKYSQYAASACVVPAKPPEFPYTSVGSQQTSVVTTTLSGVDYYVADQPTYHPHLDLGQTQLRLIKAAFSCDLARVATFMWASGTSWVRFPGTFQGATVDGGYTSAPHHAVSHTTQEATKDWLSQIDQFYSTATATVLQEFATTPDVDGNMLLDNTIVVYVTEVARAWDMDQRNMPVLVFGGKNTGVKGGTYLKITDGSLPTQTGATGNRPFNDLWLALAAVLGVPLPGLGDASQYSGPLPGVFSAI